MIHRSPQDFGYPQSRWTLQRIRGVCDWLRVDTDGGMSRLLKRLKISRKRAREYVRSPDPDYRARLELIEAVRRRVEETPERYVLLYLDELTYFRQPAVSYDYAAQGHEQPLARRGYGTNTRFRTAAALNALTGQVTYRHRSRIGVSELVQLYQDIRTDYPSADCIYVVQDNWPVHFHPNLLRHLEPQTWPFPWYTPANWQAFDPASIVPEPLPIQLLCLPSYASWCNPIEKLWRWLRQDVLHLHRQVDDWPALRQRVDDFLAQFRSGSQPLLHYVGLLPD